MARLRRRAGTQDGFTLIELVVAITLLSTVFIGLAKATDGGLRGLQSVRQRSSFTELASAEVENVRAAAFDSLAIGTTTSTVSTSTVKGIPLPYTVTRTVSWSDATQQVKKIDVTLQWTEGGGTRHASLSTLRYPGGKGALVTNQQPTAVATATPTRGHPSLVVSFDGSASSDPDGTIASYAWQFGDGATGSGSLTSHTYTSAGTYSAVLTVTDNGGLTSVATTTITVTTNHAPVASFTVVETGLTVTVDASASTDADGDPLTYSWDWGDNSTDSTGVTATHTYSSVNTYTITLTVSDGLLAATATNTPCLISSGQFTGPGLNTITLKSGGVAKNSLAFTAISNKVCTSMAVSLSSNTSTYVLSAFGKTTQTTTYTWTKSGTPSGSYVWTSGSTYTGTFTGSGGSVLTFTFTAS